MAIIEYKVTRHRQPDKHPSIASFEQSEGEAWKAERIAKNTYGKPAREIKLEDADEFELSREESRETRQDEDGNDVVFISVPADYTIEECDCTAEVQAKEQKKAQAKIDKVAAKERLADIDMDKLKTQRTLKQAILDIKTLLDL